MAIRIACPFCKTANVVNDAKRGSKVACRGCKKALGVPVAGAKKKREPEAAIQGGRKLKVKTAPAPSYDEDDDAETNGKPQKGAKKKEKPAKKGVPLYLILGGVALLLFVMMVGVAGVAGFFYWRSRNVPSDQPALAKTDERKRGEVDPEPKKEEPKQTLEKKDPLPEKKDPLPPDPIVVKKDPVPEKKDPPLPDAVQRAKLATVGLRVTTLPGGPTTEGSGFFSLEPGIVVTNVITIGMFQVNSKPPAQLEVVLNGGEPNESRLPAEVLAVDRFTNLALLKVNGPGLPSPLPLESSARITEAQKVYILGLPPTPQTSKNVAVKETMLTSAKRNPAGTLDQVKLKDGQHALNSGGPVVNADGNVVAMVHVAGNIGISADLLRQFVSGRLGKADLGKPMVQNGQAILPVKFNTIDPLNRIKNMRVEVWTAPFGLTRPASTVPPVPQPGDGPRKSYDVPYVKGVGQLDVPLLTPIPGQLCWMQAHIVTANDTTQWGTGDSLPAVPGLNPTPNPPPNPTPNPKPEVAKAKSLLSTTLQLTAFDPVDPTQTKLIPKKGAAPPPQHHMKVIPIPMMQQGKKYTIHVTSTAFTPHVRLYYAPTAAQVATGTGNLQFQCAQTGVHVIYVTSKSDKLGQFHISVTEAP